MKDKRLSAEEVIKDILKDKMSSFNKLGHSYVAIRQLVDFMQVLEKNEKDYKDKINIKVCKDIEIHPSDILSHYIVLEAVNFYETLKFMKKTYNNLPNSPTYYTKLLRVRNKMVGHKDTQEEFETAEDVINMLKELNKEATTEKIVEDILNIFKIVNEKIINKNKY